MPRTYYLSFVKPPSLEDPIQNLLNVEKNISWNFVFNLLVREFEPDMVVYHTSDTRDPTESRNLVFHLAEFDTFGNLLKGPVEKPLSKDLILEWAKGFVCHDKSA